MIIGLTFVKPKFLSSITSKRIKDNVLVLSFLSPFLFLPFLPAPSVSLSLPLCLPVVVYSFIFQGLVTTAPLPGQTTALKKMKEQEGNRFMCHLPPWHTHTHTHTPWCMHADAKWTHMLSWTWRIRRNTRTEAYTYTKHTNTHRTKCRAEEVWVNDLGCWKIMTNNEHLGGNIYRMKSGISYFSGTITTIHFFQDYIKITTNEEQKKKRGERERKKYK